MDFKELMKTLNVKFEDSDFYKIQLAHDTIITMNRLDRKMNPEECEEYMKALNTIAHYLCNGYVLIDVERATKCVKMEKEEALEMLNDIFGKDDEEDDEEVIDLLTDTEQRIFLIAMNRERKVCQTVDDEYVNDSDLPLVEVCDSIIRKVKKIWE